MVKASPAQMKRKKGGRPRLGKETLDRDFSSEEIAHLHQKPAAVALTKQLLKHFRAAHGPKLTTSSLAAYIGSKTTTASDQSLKNLIAFVGIERALTERPLDATQVKMLHQCRRNRLHRTLELAGKTRGERGALTEERIDAMIALYSTPAYMGRKGQPTYQDLSDILICWSTALRTSEMKMLTFGHLVREERGQWRLNIPKIHDSKHKGIVQVRDIHERAHMVLSARSLATSSETLVCPRWQPAKVLAWIKRAAVALDWPKGLDWVTHGLRHGVSATIFAKTGSYRRVANTTGHAIKEPKEKPGLAKHYSRTDSERLQCKAKHEQQASVARLNAQSAAGPRKKARAATNRSKALKKLST